MEKKLARNITEDRPIMEALYKMNIGLNLSKDEAKNAMVDVLSIKNDLDRSALLGSLLSGSIANRPEPDEIVGFLEGVLMFDGLDLNKYPQIKVENDIVIGMAASGKKGFKTTNISSCAAVVAAVAGAYVAKAVSNSTSSVTGSSDFMKMLGVNIDISTRDMIKVLRKIKIGVFSIENKLIKFDKMYGGRFLAPHSLSFALAAVALPIKPDVMFYGLSHPNVSLSSKVLNMLGYKNNFVITSTDNGLHYVDEIMPFGSAMVCGSYKNIVGKVSCIMPAQILNLPRYSRYQASSSFDRFENVKKSIKVLLGIGDQVLEDAVCLNAATILFLAKKAKDMEEGFNLSKEIIRSGVAINKLGDLVKKTGGDINKFNNLIKECTM